MAHVTLLNGQISGVFNLPQPQLNGYAEISDDDPRLSTWPPVNYSQAAQQALEKSDTTILRCMENMTAVPSAWATYRETLREIVASNIGPLPVQPSYPAGT